MNLKEFRILLVVPLIFVVATIGNAYAEEGATRSESSRVAAALYLQDASLNTIFQDVLNNSPEIELSAIKQEQRKWIMKRNEVCKLSIKETSDNAWLANLNSVKAECVLNETKLRIATLTESHKTSNQLDHFTTTNTLQPIKEFIFPIGHMTGKWYAEISLNRLMMEKVAQKKLLLGVDDINSFIAITPAMSEDDNTVVGIMLDLDRHYVDSRTAKYQPNDALHGAPLMQNEKIFAIKLQSQENLSAWLKNGQVRINYGQQPFTYSIPPGYEPWFYSRNSEDITNWIVPSYERISNLDHTETAMAYWNWLLNQNGQQNPVTDKTGQYCGLLQDKNYWFLAGANATDKIERQCIVPYGVNIVVPVVSIMLAGDSEVDCKSTIEVAKLAPYQKTFLEIDQIRFDRLNDYMAHAFSCEELHLGERTFAKHANWFGLWVPLKPLTRGEHVITFGGRINALNADRKVTYRIMVK